MCGLVGVWQFDQPSKTPLNELGLSMARRLIHRGPDSYGVWHDEKDQIVLAHQRLSILDLSENGHQPMVSHSRNWVIIYNGEIYNAPELRKELIQKGILFKGTSDTEVILEACECWGIETAVQKFIGMFAFALWNRDEKRLFLVRDRLGIKPLYFGWQNTILFFGSELKSFTPHSSFKPEIDREALSTFFRYGYISAPKSIFKNVYKVMPGFIVSIDARRNVSEYPYWRLSDVVYQEKINPYSETECIAALDQLLEDAVKKCMLTDVPLGAFLSGGVDSSVVVAQMKKLGGTPKTFTIGFHEQAYNESPYARSVAQHLGTEHHELMVKSSDALAVIPQLSDIYDEPFADSSQIPTFLVSRLARNTVTVSLSGDGGDELFAGYTRYLALSTYWSWFKYVPFSVRKAIAKAMSAIPYPVYQNILRAFPQKIRPSNVSEKVNKLILLLRSHHSHSYRVINSLWQNPCGLVKEGFDPKNQPALIPLNDIEQMQYSDMLTYLPDDILTKVDRASMAVSLETRVPLLDHRVVEWAFRLPLHMKIRQNSGKWILRQVLARYLPKMMIDRPKQGFGIPIGDWLKGPLQEWAEDLLSVRSIQSHDMLHSGPIRETWEAHLQGTRNFQYPLWTVLSFQAWHQRWIKR